MDDILHFSEYTKFLIGLLILIDPIGSIPVFMAITRGELADHRNKIILIAGSAFAAILAFFLFLGDFIFSYSGLSIEAFQVAGGLLLLKIALDMMNDAHGKSSVTSSKSSAVKVALVPLAIPLLAGPGAITMTLIYGGVHPTIEHSLLVSAVILSAAIITGVVLKLSGPLENLIGESGMHVVNQVMAIIVAAIGVEFVLDGIAMHFGIAILGVGH